MIITKKNYKYKTWKETFQNKSIKLTEMEIPYDWKNFFESILKDPKIKVIEKKLNEDINEQIVPYPELLFTAFYYTRFKDVKVVFIGQDPYFHLENGIPQATGLAFSVPEGLLIPDSLKNIYANLDKHHHLMKKPVNGNLEFWAYQGCLMLNSALTVIIGKKKSHTNIWNWFTNKIIKKLSDEKDYIIFVLWGADALEKIKIIDIDKHPVIISSHPSGLSCNKTLDKYPAFMDLDSFGLINEKLKEKNIQTILW